MGSVYKKTVTKPLPRDAEVITKKKGEQAKWTDRNGKKRSAPVTRGRNGKPRIRVEARTYTAKYRDGVGIVREHATGCRAKRSAEMVLAKLEQEAEKIRAGVLTAAESEMSKHRDTPLTEHIANYIDHQTAKGVHPQRVKNTRNRLRRLAADCRLHRLADLTADALERWMLDKAEHDDRAKGPMGAGTRNGYREAAIGFGNWLLKRKRISTNPFLDVPKADKKADCRRKRRALTEDELRQLLAMARRRPLESALMIRRGKNKGQLKARVKPKTRERLNRVGRERALIYKTMALTGLRKNELTTLTVECLELDADPPHLTLDPNNEKNREGNSIPLRSDLAEDIRAWLREKAERADKAGKANGKPGGKNGQETIYGLPPGTRLFDVPTGLLRILNLDLEAGGIPKRDARGRTVDIHALRHTFGTMLSAAGVAPRTAQEAMRHSSIDLTMNVYTDPALLDVAGAIEMLPHLEIDRNEAAAEATEPATIRLEREAANRGAKGDATGRNGSRRFAPEFAAKFAPTTGHRGQKRAFPVKTAASDAAPRECLARAVRSCYDNSNDSLTTADNAHCEPARKASIPQERRSGRRGRWFVIVLAAVRAQVCPHK